MEKIKAVFIPRRSRIRPYKIAKALKYTGKVYLVLICEETFYDKHLFEGIFDEVHFYTKKNILFKIPKAEKIYRRLNERFGFGFKRMMKLVNQANPDIIHCFAEPYNHIVHVLKNTKIPVIMSDGADFTGITEGIENISKRVLKEEKFCFENVSGIIYKGPKLVTDYYRLFGFMIDCKELTWFDHTDKDLIEMSVSNSNNEIHLVYTGNISSSPKKAYCYYIPLAKILAEQRIHLHIYPNPWQYSTSLDYLELSKNEHYFHFHQPLEMKELIREISNYDFGLWVHSSEKSNRTQEYKMKTGMVNKMFTYLEAGLPVIVSDSREYGASIVQASKIGFIINDNDWPLFRVKIEALNRKDLLFNVNEFREMNSLQKKSDELMEFYKKVKS